MRGAAACAAGRLAGVSAPRQEQAPASPCAPKALPPNRRTRPPCAASQAYEEFDEEVQEAEELEARALAGPGAGQADRDDEIKPFVHK